MADQGSDENVLPPKILDLLKKANSSLFVTKLPKTEYYGTVDADAAPLPCSREVISDVRLRIRHGTQLLLRGMKWRVSDHVLRSIGLDNQKLMKVACDRHDGVINVPDMLEKLKDGTSTSGFINALLGGIPFQEEDLQGSTFHSQGADDTDQLEDSNVYVDLGDDPEDELDKALDTSVADAKANGLYDSGTQRLRDLLHQYKQVLE